MKDHSSRIQRFSSLLVSLIILAGACADSSDPAPQDTKNTDDTPSTDATEEVTPDVSKEPTEEQKLILGVPQTEEWSLPGLLDDVQVVRVESDIPHIYAKNPHDLALVNGFVMARHRYFMMDLARRLALGKVTEILGSAALETDMESRGTGMTYVADQITAGLDEEMGAYADAFASGVNAYIDEVAGGTLPAPSELALAALLLGAEKPSDLMKPFTRRDVAAVGALLLFESSFGGGEIGRTKVVAQLDSLFEGAALQELRRKGTIDDLWSQIAPILPVSSAAGWGLETSDTGSAKPGAALPTKTVGALPQQMLSDLATKLEKFELRLWRDRESGFGSNAWAVAGSKTENGETLLAGDGHLSLSVPSTLYQQGLNTRVFGDGDVELVGLTVPGFPTVALGTNGKVAWSQTNLYGDVTDYYREEIQLDENGRPAKSLFKGEWKDLIATEESYQIADIPALDSVGGEQVWTRWTTFDGRWLITIEGRSANPGDELAQGESLISMTGSFVVPEDKDGDDTIEAISMDYAAFDNNGFLNVTAAFGKSKDIHEYRGWLRGLVGAGLNFVGADSQGNILYSGYQGAPCRNYLQRDPETGKWLDGADPTLILDGTTYGAFRIPTKNGLVDEAPGADDPYACVVPFEKSPQSLNPERGYVLNANNDIGNITTDNSLSDDPWFVGGPYDAGFRADTINRNLKTQSEAQIANVEGMATIQGNHDSRLGEMYSFAMLSSITQAKTLSETTGPFVEHEQRLVDIYNAHSDTLLAVHSRISAWGGRGFQAESGVETFYEQPSEDDKKDAVATMIFNAWFSRVLQGVFNDEQLPDVWEPNGTQGQLRAFKRFFIEGRGKGNPAKISSWNEATEESAFFDRLGTDEIERSDEIVLQALVDALGFLQSEPSAPDAGGFGTTDMNNWIWGLRHQVTFESLLLDFLPSDSDFGPLVTPFSITTNVLPLAESMDNDDPRKGLKWFPRHGDQYGVDAGNPGMGGTNFTYGSGPVMRMVIALKDGKVWGQNIVPGGQSALTDSEFFADQAALWLGNKTLPLRFHVSDVIEGAVGREYYKPE